MENEKKVGLDYFKNRTDFPDIPMPEVKPPKSDDPLPECKEGFTGNEKIEKTLKGINKELHGIVLELEKLNRFLRYRR